MSKEEKYINCLSGNIFGKMIPQNLTFSSKTEKYMYEYFSFIPIMYLKKLFVRKEEMELKGYT